MGCGGKKKGKKKQRIIKTMLGGVIVGSHLDTQQVVTMPSRNGWAFLV